jgi:hypothetical protein
MDVKEKSLHIGRLPQRLHKKCELDRRDQQYEKISFHTTIEVNNLILHDGGITVVHNVIQNLEMFMLVACEWIRILHENVNLTTLDYCYKIANENILSFSKLDQNVNYLQ